MEVYVEDAVSQAQSYQTATEAALKGLRRTTMTEPWWQRRKESYKLLQRLLLPDERTGQQGCLWMLLLMECPEIVARPRSSLCTTSARREFCADDNWGQCVWYLKRTAEMMVAGSLHGWVIAKTTESQDCSVVKSKLLEIK